MCDDIIFNRQHQNPGRKEQNCHLIGPCFDKDPPSSVHLVNFFSQRISLLLIYTIEVYRVGNRGTILCLSSVYSTNAQLQSITGPLLISILLHQSDCGGNNGIWSAEKRVEHVVSVDGWKVAEFIPVRK